MTRSEREVRPVEVRMKGDVEDAFAVGVEEVVILLEETRCVDLATDGEVDDQRGEKEPPRAAVAPNDGAREGGDDPLCSLQPDEPRRDVPGLPEERKGT